MKQDFAIDQVSWHTSTPGNTESREQIIQRFFSVVTFLQANGLLCRVLAKTVSDINENFAIRSTDLTDEGFAVMQAAYDKWLQKIDGGMDVADVSLLEQVFNRIRAK
jgi:hypothetical protein